MDASRALLGTYVPGGTPWHGAPVALKYLVFLALVIPAVASPWLWLSGVLLAVAAVAVLSTGASVRLALGLPVGALVLFAVLIGYHAWASQVDVGLRIVAAMTVALYASRVLLMTTPMPALIDALVGAARPLRLVGASPERFGLAVAIMVRSIPFVASAFGAVRDAARARGLERNVLAQVTPVMIQTVAFARTTGEALAARGLGDD